jgi:putative restriction endonuclease
MCGLRLMTPDGHTVLRAAHVVPYTTSFNDDPRNGLGFRPRHHWCFGEALMGIGRAYEISVSNALDE